MSGPASVPLPPQGVGAASGAQPKWKRALRLIFLVSFCGACVGVLALIVMYHAPAVNVPIFFFTTRPALVWFAMLLPFLLVGVMALRRRWFLLGCALWVIGFISCDNVLAWIRPFHERARARFEASQMAYLSFGRAHEGDLAVLDMPLRIVGWNMDGGRWGATEAVAQLAGLQPDLVLIEEYMDDIGDAINASAYFHKFHFARSLSVAIVSRFPVAPVNGALLQWRSGVWKVQLAADRWITCIVVQLRAPELKTQLLRGWTWKGLRDMLEQTRSELQTVYKMVALPTDGSPVLLAGDFNVPSNYPDLSIATGEMKDAFIANGFGWGKTAPNDPISFWSRLRHPSRSFRAARPDMIFVPPDATVFDAFAEPTTYSDHCPVIAEVSIPVPRLKPSH